MPASLNDTAPDPRRTRSTVLLAWACTVMVAICLVFTFVMAAWHRDVGEGLGVAGERIASSVAQQVDRNIEMLDLSLRAVADHWGGEEVRSLSPHLRDMVLFDSLIRAPGLGVVVVIDTEGRMAAESTDALAPGTSVRDRDYFRVHLTSPEIGLFVSKPFVSRDTGRHIIALSRRITDRSGNFAGVVVGTIYLDYLSKLYAGLTNEDDSAVTLLRTDGTIITREPPARGDEHSWVGGSDAFMRMRVSRSGAFEGESPVDGKPRILSFHRVGGLPLIQAVEVGGGAAYEAWWRRAAAVSGLLALLSLSVVGLCVALHRELERRVLAEAALSRLAGTDPLTGLANRRSFDNALSAAWSSAVEKGEHLALLMIDVDAFKNYNDLFGHQAGDEVLRQLARFLDSTARERGGMACRWGGEEFGVLLPNFPVPEALAVADALLGSLRALGMEHPKGVEGVVTISVGVAATKPSHRNSSGKLISSADAALYMAKREGRNCSRVYRSSDRPNQFDGLLKRAG